MGSCDLLLGSRELLMGSCELLMGGARRRGQTEKLSNGYLPNKPSESVSK